jgi:hypothetical protein
VLSRDRNTVECFAKYCAAIKAQNVDNLVSYCVLTSNKASKTNSGVLDTILFHDQPGSMCRNTSAWFGKLLPHDCGRIKP